MLNWFVFVLILLIVSVLDLYTILNVFNIKSYIFDTMRPKKLILMHDTIRKKGFALKMEVENGMFALGFRITN